MSTPVYVKTPKGLEEMTTRRYKLSPKERQVLIMLNGKRTLIEAAATLPVAEMEAIGSKLLDEGFVVTLGGQSAVTTGIASPNAPAAASRIASPANDAKRFEMASNFMANTLNAFVGMASSSVSSQIDNAADLAQLRDLYDSWRKSISLTAQGRRELPALEDKLAALLS